MRETKFDYLIRGKDGNVYHCPYTLSQLEGSIALSEKNPADIIAKRQYTGLKDKNGVEEFDNDIVRFFWEAEGQRYYSTSVIEWSTEGAYFRFRDLTTGVVRTLDCVEAGAREVIGNIYENPEMVGES